MAYNKFGMFDGPLDAGLGLIYRLNRLWGDVDIYAARGDFEGWNARLDRVFCNLLYREDLVIEKSDDNGEIVSVELSDEDEEIYNYLNKKYKAALKEYRAAKTKEGIRKAKEKIFEALFLKDIGLRKFMRELKLYLKETTGNPSKAMWGG